VLTSYYFIIKNIPQTIGNNVKYQNKKVIENAGYKSRYGADLILPKPSESKLPKLGSGDSTPKPIKLRKASKKIATGIRDTNVTKIIGMQFGIMYLEIILV